MEQLLSALFALLLTITTSCPLTSEPVTEPTGDISTPVMMMTPTLPELAKEPDNIVLTEQINNIYERCANGEITDIECDTQVDQLYRDFDAQLEIYKESLKTLRGDGVGDTGTLKNYTASSIVEILSSGKENENIAYSPANLYFALSMLAETTEGNSQKQILDLLGYESVEDMREQANAIYRNLYYESSVGKTTLANSLWADCNLVCNDDTVQNLTDNYYSYFYSTDMGTDAANHALAEWINENTGGLLTDEAGAVETSEDTLLSLVSTLYFKDIWLDQFMEDATETKEFTNADGTTSQVPFMQSEQSGIVVEGENYTMASLPFDGGSSMVFVLPDEETAVNDLLENPDIFTADFSEKEICEVVWSIPKFDITSSLNLADALVDLGVTDVFDETKADFSALIDTSAVLDIVQQSARVKIDENGCEAAAFTVLTAEATSLIQANYEITLDRPFIFIITGVDNLPLFTGVVNQIVE